MLGGRRKLWRGRQCRRVAHAAAPIAIAANPFEPVAAPAALSEDMPGTPACAPMPGQSDAADAPELDVGGVDKLEADEILSAVGWSAGMRWKENKKAPSACRHLLGGMNPADIALILRAYRSSKRESTEGGKGEPSHGKNCTPSLQVNDHQIQEYRRRGHGGLVTNA